MTCKDELKKNEAMEHMLRSNEAMAQMEEAIGHVNEWADCTDGVPVDLWYISSQPELAAQNHLLIDVLELIRRAMNEDTDLIVPVVFPPGAFGIEDPMDLKPGDTLTAQEDIRIKLQSLPLGDSGAETMVAFTSYEELEAGPATSSIRMGIADLMHRALLSEQFEGLMLNPWGCHHFFLTKVLIQMILRADVIQKLQMAGADRVKLARERAADTEQNWCTRAFYTLEGIALADGAEKELFLQDVLMQLQGLAELASACSQTGTMDEMWKQTGVPKAFQAWYYSQVQDGLTEMQDYPQTKGRYWEMVELFKELFMEDE